MSSLQNDQYFYQTCRGQEKKTLFLDKSTVFFAKIGNELKFESFQI